MLLLQRVSALLLIKRRRKQEVGSWPEQALELESERTGDEEEGKWKLLERKKRRE